MAMIDGSTAAVIGSVLVLAGTIVTVRGADRRGKAEAERQAAGDEQTADAARFAQTVDLTRYIREQVKEETKGIREELADVKRLVGTLHGRLSRTREAVRDYIRQVRSLWGRSEQPPPVDGHLLELLGEDDVDDTWTAQRIADIVAENQNRTDPADSAD